MCKTRNNTLRNYPSDKDRYRDNIFWNDWFFFYNLSYFMVFWVMNIKTMFCEFIVTTTFQLYYRVNFDKEHLICKINDLDLKVLNGCQMFYMIFLIERWTCNEHTSHARALPTAQPIKVFFWSQAKALSLWYLEIKWPALS